MVEQSQNVNEWSMNGTTFEYGAAANPVGPWPLAVSESGSKSVFRAALLKLGAS